MKATGINAPFRHYGKIHTNRKRTDEAVQRNVKWKSEKAAMGLGEDERTSGVQNRIKRLKLSCKGDQALSSIFKQLSFSHQNGNRSSTITLIMSNTILIKNRKT